MRKFKFDKKYVLFYQRVLVSNTLIFILGFGIYFLLKLKELIE
jgi:hypothetical protein